MQNTLSKTEILRNKKSIEELFSQGKGFIQYPLRCVYSYNVLNNDSYTQTDFDIQAMFTVSKRYHKRAVRRNKMRRRIKESFRLHKNDFIVELKQLGVTKIKMAFLYVGKEENSFETVDESIKKIIHNVIRKIQKDTNINTSSVD